MERAGLSKSDLARAVGLTPGAVTSWTQKDNPIDPPIRTIRKICEAVGVDLAGFFEPFRDPSVTGAGNQKVALGARVRRWRKHSGLTLRRCAELSGLTPPMLCKIEKGGRRLSANDMQTLSRVLGVSIECLYEEDPPSKPSARKPKNAGNPRKAVAGLRR